MFLLFGFLLLSCSSLSYALSPTEVVIGMFEKISEPDASREIPEEVIVSPFCGPEKLRLMERSWRRRASWLVQEKVSFSPCLERLDQDLAAVLIHAVPENRPDAVAVISLALKFEGGQWRIGPQEGSFQNIGLGFSNQLRERVIRLERWMASERVEALAQLKTLEQKRFDDALKGAVVLEKLSVEHPEIALSYFLESAESGDLKQILVWLGVLERDELGERQWDREIRIASLGVQGLDARRVWRLLTSRKVMKVIMEGDGDGDEYSAMVSFLSDFEVLPEEKNRTPIRFRLLRTEGGWRVELPAFFAHADESMTAHRAAHRKEFSWEDREVSKQMGGVFEKTYQEVRGDRPLELLDSVVSLMRAGDLKGYLLRLFREKNVINEGEEGAIPQLDQRQLQVPQGAQLRMRGIANQKVSASDERRLGRYQEAVNWWAKGVGDRDVADVQKSQFYHEGKIALGVLTVEPTGGDWTPEILKVWMIQEGSKWCVVPGIDRPMENSYPKELVETQSSLWEKAQEEIPEIQRQYFSKLWQKVALFDPSGVSVSREEALPLLQKWRRLLAEGTMMELLERSLITKVPKKPEQVLNDLKFVKAGAVSSTVPDRIIEVATQGRFTAFSMIVDDAGGHERACPLVIVAPSNKGPRVLVDIELFLETNKAKKLRNLENLDKIEATFDQEDAKAILNLFEWHQRTAGPVWTKWNQQRSEQSEGGEGG